MDLLYGKNRHSRSVFQKDCELFVKEAVHFVGLFRSFYWLFEDFCLGKAAFGHIRRSSCDFFGAMSARNISILAKVSL